MIGNGLAVMDAIAAVPTYDQGSPFDSLPLVNYTSGDAVQLSNLVTVGSVAEVSAYSVSSDDPAVATASVSGSTLTYDPAGAGTTHLTVTATGVDGTTASQTFALTVTAPTGLSPAFAASTVPTSVVAGTHGKGVVTLNLTNTTAAADKGVNHVDLYAVPAGATDVTAGVRLATATRRTNLAASASQRLALPVRLLPSGVGTYTLVARATDAAGDVIATAGPTLTVAAPAVMLSATVTASPTALVAGRPVTFTVTVVNAGNVDSTGRLTLSVGLSVDGSIVAVPVVSVAKGVRVKAAGGTVVLRVRGKVPSGTSAGSYLPLASVTQGTAAAKAVATTPLTVG